LRKKTPPPPPQKTIWGVSYKKSTYLKFFFLKMGLIRECNLWSCLIKGIIDPKRHPAHPQSLKNYKWWFVRTFHLSSMWIKNNNLQWKYQPHFSWRLSREKEGLQPITNYQIKNEHQLLYISKRCVGVVKGCPGYWARDSRAMLAIMAKAFMKDRSPHTLFFGYMLVHSRSLNFI